MKHKANIYPILLLALLCNATATNGAAATSPGTAGIGGAACVIAKKLGNSLAIEWATGKPSAAHAIERAKQALHARGYEYVFPQSNSSNSHGWMVIIKTQYRNYAGRQRTSYGCGFSAQSPSVAENNAQANLRAYSWGWKESMGYQVIEKLKY